MDIRLIIFASLRMDIATYLNAAKQQEAHRRLWNTTNNIANGTTDGFAAGTIATTRSFVNEINNQTSYPNNTITIPDLTPNGASKTDRPLDVALNGPGFFLVQTPNGIRYTKAGHFVRNNEGELVTLDNNLVLSSDGQPIVFDETDSDPIIDTEGKMFINGEERATLGVVEFDNLRLIRKDQNGATLLETNQLARPAENTRVMQGMLAESSVKTINETTNLIYIQREADMSRKVAESINEMYRNANRIITSQGGQ
jgi:flagellar basal-body rod protein FlgF